MMPQTSNFGTFEYTGDTLRHTYENGFGFYAQDAFHVTPRLVLNYGLRWDYYGVVAERNHFFSDFIPSTGLLEQVGPGGLSNLYNPDKKDFAPRVSVVWDGPAKEGLSFGPARHVLRRFLARHGAGPSALPAFFAPGPAYNNFPAIPRSDPDGEP